MKTKNKNQKKLIAIILSVLLMVTSLPISSIRAASLTIASDLLSNSEPGVSASHTVEFTTQINLLQNDTVRVSLANQFDLTGANVVCPANMTGSIVANDVFCTADVLIPADAYSITINLVINPAATGSYLINLVTTPGETAQVMVSINDNVRVTASVASTLTFAINPLSTSTTVNGSDTTQTSGTSTLAFGVLQVGTSSIMGQELSVITNANDGYNVTVEQDQNMVSNAGSDIDAFINGTSTNPQNWQTPANVLDQEWTYGHFGLTTDDVSLSSGNAYGGGLWKGFNGTSTIEVLFHTGPADGLTQDKGVAKVAYRIEVSALQEAGDYTNTLTYIATPTY